MAAAIRQLLAKPTSFFFDVARDRYGTAIEQKRIKEIKIFMCMWMCGCVNTMVGAPTHARTHLYNDLNDLHCVPFMLMLMCLS